MIDKNLIAEIARSVQCQYHWTEADIEKFAELIVSECAKVCREQTNEYAMELDRENCASAIEEHFGIE